MFMTISLILCNITIFYMSYKLKGKKKEIDSLESYIDDIEDKYFDRCSTLTDKYDKYVEQAQTMLKEYNRLTKENMTLRAALEVQNKKKTE